MKYASPSFVIVLFLMIIGFSTIYSIEPAFSIGDLDRDNDGILDEFDKCLLTLETYNKFQDDDGCPDTVPEEEKTYQFPDADGDGIEDRLDSCLYLPETINDYLDFDGCPEIVPNTSDKEVDSDSDSIVDSIDSCPLEKETVNGFRDEDGCPDSWSVPIEEKTPSISIDNQCRAGQILVLRINANDSICISHDTAKKWESYGIAKIIGDTSVEEKTPEIIESPIIQEDVIQEIEEIPPSSSDSIIEQTDYSFSNRPAKEQRNIETIVEFFEAFSPWDKNSISELLADEYVEHNPTLPGDKEGFLETLDEMFSIIPPEMIKYDLKRIYADDDYVITHSYFQGETGTESSIIDIFRINEPGKIIEHWDIIQEIPETSMNNNTMFYLD